MRRVVHVFLACLVVGVLLSGCAAVGPTPVPKLPLAPAAVTPSDGGALGEGIAGARGGAKPGPARETPERPAWVTPVTDANFGELVARHRPNEMGEVLILEYHDFKDVEQRWARRWDNFSKDLETLYAKGYRAVNLNDYLAARMKLPAGTSPVIFTFDDSLSSQLKLVQNDGQWDADPRSAVGIMLAFTREHPDFGTAGTFYVNFTPVPFRERGNWQEKIRFLTEHGFEVANHSLYHDDLAKLSDDGVRNTLAEQVRRLREVLPSYDGDTLALPFGNRPKRLELAIQGDWNGVAYKHKAVLLVGADPVPSPYDKRLKLMALTRVQAIDSEFKRWLPYLDQHRYISDGDPDTVVIPEDTMAHLDAAAVQGKQVRTYPGAR